MKGKNLFVLIIVAAVLVGLAIGTSRKPSRPGADLMGKKLLPELPVNDVEKIVVTGPSVSAEVAKTEAGWVLPSRYGYPANFAKIRTALLKLADMKIGQVQTVTDAQKKSLKMSPPSATNAQSGTAVALLGKGGKSIASLLLGAEHTRSAPGQQFGGYPDGQFVSTDNGKSVYLVAQPLDDFSLSARDWMDTDLVNVQGADIETIQISGPKAPALAFGRKPDGTGMALGALAPNEEMDATKVSSVESALSYLRFEDVADPTLKDEQMGMDSPTVYRAETKKGEIYTVKIGGSPTNDTRRFIRVEVALKAAPPPPPVPAVTNAPAVGSSTNAAGTNATAQADAKAAEERKKQEEAVKAQNAKFGKWTYLIDSYKAESLAAKRESLVKIKEEKKPEAATNDVPGVATAPAAATAPAPQTITLPADAK